MNEVDELAKEQNVFKWEHYKPSTFFNKIMDNLSTKIKNISKSPSVRLNSPSRRKVNGIEE
jgi:hypothetical protein